MATSKQSSKKTSSKKKAVKKVAATTKSSPKKKKKKLVTLKDLRAKGQVKNASFEIPAPLYKAAEIKAYQKDGIRFSALCRKLVKEYVDKK